MSTKVLQIRPQREISYCTRGTPVTDVTDVTIDKNIQENEIDTWDARMTTLQGEFVTNSKFIVWLLKVMKSTSPVDVETTDKIRADVAKNLSDDRHVKDTRKFVAELMPHRQQCSSVVSHHLDHEVPDDVTDRIMQSLPTLTVKVDVLTKNFQGAQYVVGNTDTLCQDNVD